MKIAFIETKYHQRSQSSVFFKEILSKKHELLVMLDEPRSGSTGLKVEEINSYNFDAIIFWQFIKSPTIIAKIKCKNIIWIPMYDSEVFRKLKKIRLYGYTSLNLKIISFSKAQTDLFKKNGLDNILDIKYFPKINENNISMDDKNINILFWQRRKEVNWDIVKKIIGETKINKLTIKNNFDLGHNNKIYPTSEEIKKYNINIINKWLDNKEYIKVLKDHNVFITPRQYEGIGMGFLDAMSYGIAVVAPNKPTMNEYIVDGYNGYLYDLKNPKPIDFSNINEVRNNIKNSIDKDWGENILDFVENNSITKTPKINYLYKIYGGLLETIITLKRDISNFAKKD